MADFPFVRKLTSGDQRDAPTCCVTDAQWLPSRGADIIAIAGSDGRFYLCTRNGRLEKVQEAHKGAVLAVRWSSDGTALATGMYASHNYPLYIDF